MVLDLTNTNRYYDPVEFTAHNVRYCKVTTQPCSSVPTPPTCHPVLQCLVRVSIGGSSTGNGCAFNPAAHLREVYLVLPCACILTNAAPA